MNTILREQMTTHQQQMQQTVDVLRQQQEIVERHSREMHEREDAPERIVLNQQSVQTSNSLQKNGSRNTLSPSMISIKLYLIFRHSII